MKFGQIFIWLVLFIIGSLIVSFLIYPDSFQSFKSNIASKINGNVISSLFSDSPSIKELSQNPDNYYGKNISISGKLESAVGGYSLWDSNGYFVWIGDNCIENQRGYDYNLQIYTAKGIWTSPIQDENGGWAVGARYKPHFECSVPLI